jgi:predicted  nucleic acid-binding Zn-ribbon protein
VRNIETFLKLLAVAFFAGGLVSCSSPKNQSSEHLAQAIDKAQRLSQRAVALMANPYYTQKSTHLATPIPKRLAGGAIEPFMKSADEAVATRIGLEKESSDLDVGRIDAVHPEAIKILEAAGKELEIALKDDLEAGEAEKTLAKSTQANILKLQAQYYWALAMAEDRKIDPAMEIANHQLDLAQINAESINAVEKVVTMGAKDVQKLSDEATADLAKLNKESTDKKAQIDALTSQIGELTATTAKQQTDMAAMERDSREIVGEESLKLSDKITVLRQDMNAKMGQMQGLEIQRSQLQDEMKVLGVRIATTQAEVTAVGQSLQAKKGVVDSTEKSVTQAQENLKKAREAALPALKDAFSAYAAWQEDAKKVSTLLTLALGAGAGNTRDAHALAEQGAMSMDLGAVNVELGQGAARMKQTRQELEGTWSQKVSGSTIGGGAELPPVPKDEAEVFLKAAADAFKKAATAYNSAVRALPNGAISQNILWVYQASEAKAWRALAAVSADDATVAIPNAQRLEVTAKEGRENSPYLKNVDTP